MDVPNIWTICIIIGVFYCRSVCNQEFNGSLREARLAHRPKAIEDQRLTQISRELENIEELHQVLSKILIERVSGTPNNAIVREYISDYMENLGWTIDRDQFLQQTPIGRVNFTNIIAKVNPNAKRYLTIACHYDSKLMDGFLGATDSAVPCAIMLNLATTLQKYLRAVQNTDLSLQYVFFDGEEAFVQWNENDSIYGARHLAKKWANENQLEKIDLLVLLDLLGAAQPSFYNYFPDTEGWYYHMVDVESRLGANGFLVEHAQNSAGHHKNRNRGYFQPYSVRMGIEDDHIPFLRRGVPILHLIPTPFPDVWHTTSDDLRAIDFAACTNLNKIIGFFLMEYLHISPA